MINPESYLNTIKHQINIIDIQNNYVFFDFVATPFRLYNGRPINFTSNLIEYTGKYCIVDSQNCLELDSVSGLTIGTTLDIYGTFKISKTNELTTLQDITEMLKSEETEVVIDFNIFGIKKSGKPGIVNDLDKLKINQSEFFVFDSATKTFDDNYIQLIQFPINKFKKNRIVLYNVLDKNYVFDGDLISELIDSQLLMYLKINNCTFTDLNKLTFRFKQFTFDDLTTWISIEVKSENVQNFIFGFSTTEIFEQPLEVPTTESIISLNTDILAQDEIVLNKNLISISPKYIKKVIESFTTADTTTEDIPSALQVGAIEPGDIIPMGTNITMFIKQLVSKLFNPSFTPPLASLSINGVSSNVESGLVGDISLFFDFNRGSINGKNVGGIWNATSLQNPRAGIVNRFLFEGSDNDVNPNFEITNHNFVDGANTFNAQVDYDEGYQPLNSKNENYDLPLPAGMLTTSKTITGRRKTFYGADPNNNTPYSTSEEVRTLLSENILNLSNGSIFNINIPVGSKMVCFAYPANLRDVSSVIYIEAMNTEIKSVFTLINIDVEGLNGYLSIPYKFYYYVPVEPFAEEVNYKVTI